ncbi:MAG: glycosyltransferase [Candidatus Omnitrophica bacterium]|nr:glycosyltransferase [Candidatus Omnitrophota bacterium]
MLTRQPDTQKALILFVDLFNIGGIQKYNKHLCDALASEFSHIGFTGISLYDLRSNEDGYKWPNIKISISAKVKIRPIQKIVFIAKAILAVVKEKPRFLICCHVDIAPLALFLKRFFYLKYAVLTHGTDVWYLRKGIKLEALKNADTIITVSAHTKNKLVANGIFAYKIELLKDTIDTSFFHPKPINNKLVTSLGLENKYTLLTVGRIRSDEKYKGHDVMISVVEKLGSEYIWLVIGAGADYPRLKSKAEKLGIIGKTRFLGNVTREDLVDYYNLCDCFVMPSKGEGFGIVFLEALACGKPVIAGDKDGSLEPLMNGKLGFAVDPDNLDEIIKAVHLACSVKKDTDHVQRDIKEVETNFGITAFNKRVKEIFSGELKCGKTKR